MNVQNRNEIDNDNKLVRKLNEIVYELTEGYKLKNKIGILEIDKSVVGLTKHYYYTIDVNIFIKELSELNNNISREKLINYHFQKVFFNLDDYELTIDMLDKYKNKIITLHVVENRFAMKYEYFDYDISDIYVE